jgi:hypothetical protein
METEEEVLVKYATQARVADMKREANIFYP